jgi:hypothetical protein
LGIPTRTQRKFAERPRGASSKHRVCIVNAELGGAAAEWSVDSKDVIKLNELVRTLNDAIHEAVTKTAGGTPVMFVDASKRFERHRLCDDESAWIRGLSADFGALALHPEPVKTESFHPTREGHGAYATAFREAMQVPVVDRTAVIAGNIVLIAVNSGESKRPRPAHRRFAAEVSRRIVLALGWNRIALRVRRNFEQGSHRLTLVLRTKGGKWRIYRRSILVRRATQRPTAPGMPRPKSIRLEGSRPTALPIQQ